MRLNFTRVIGSALSAFILASFSYVLPSNAQSRYVDQIKEQLINAAIVLGLDDYSLSHDPYIDTLSSRDLDTLTLTLYRGISYQIIGVCDSDCSDIDMFLYDDNGNMIDSDESSDDIPIVQVTPRWTATFEVELNMYQCSSSYCYYGIGVFADN